VGVINANLPNGVSPNYGKLSGEVVMFSAVKPINYG
jgi:hypothetical protein